MTEAGLSFSGWSKSEFESGVPSVPALTWYVGLHGSWRATCWCQRSSTHWTEGTHKNNTSITSAATEQTHTDIKAHVFTWLPEITQKPRGIVLLCMCGEHFSVYKSNSMSVNFQIFFKTTEETRRAHLDSQVRSAINNYKLWDKKREEGDLKNIFENERQLPHRHPHPPPLSDICVISHLFLWSLIDIPSSYTAMHH